MGPRRCGAPRSSTALLLGCCFLPLLSVTPGNVIYGGVLVLEPLDFTKVLKGAVSVSDQLFNPAHKAVTFSPKV